MKTFLSENRDVFAWNYTEIPGLDPDVAVHRLSVDPAKKPVKQMQRRFRPERLPKIEAEVEKLLAAGFIREVQYPVANIVLSRSRRRTDRSVSASISVTSTMPVQKMSSHYP